MDTDSSPGFDPDELLTDRQPKAQITDTGGSMYVFHTIDEIEDKIESATGTFIEVDTFTWCGDGTTGPPTMEPCTMRVRHATIVSFREVTAVDWRDSLAVSRQSRMVPRMQPTPLLIPPSGT